MENKKPKIIHTYMSDMANAVRENEELVIRAALEEKEKREREENFKKIEGTSSQKTFWVLGAIFLLIISAGGIYFVHTQKEKIGETKIIDEKIETFINYDESSYLNISELSNSSLFLEKIKTELNNVSSENFIKSIFIKKNIIEINKNGDEVRTEETIGPREFLSFLGGDKPSSFLMSLSDKYMIGSHKKEKEVGIFFIFQTNDYNTTYSKFLEWEKTIAGDLKSILSLEKYDDYILSKEFEDKVIKNRDVRVLYNQEGDGILFYSFIDKNKFIITNNLKTFEEVFNRNIIKNISFK